VTVGGQSLEKSWVLLKEIITSDRVLQYFNPKLPIKLSSDVNQDGLGALILQLHGSTRKPVACERLHQFIYWTKTDHKAFVNIMKKPFNDCPLRIQRLLMGMQRYDLDVTYTPGKQLLQQMLYPGLQKGKNPVV